MLAFRNGKKKDPGNCAVISFTTVTEGYGEIPSWKLYLGWQIMPDQPGCLLWGDDWMTGEQ